MTRRAAVDADDVSDPHRADVVTSTGGTVIALPDTSGNRWAPAPPE